MNKSGTDDKSGILPLEVSQGTRFFVQVDPDFPYTVLYDRPGKQVVAVIDNDDPIITMPRSVDVQSLLIVGSVDEEAWEATRKKIDHGNPGAPGGPGNGNGRIS